MIKLAPRLKFYDTVTKGEVTDLNMGRTEFGSEVTKSFILKNDGKWLMEKIAVRIDDPDVKVQVKSDVLEPNESTVVEVTFKPSLSRDEPLASRILIDGMEIIGERKKKVVLKI